MSMDDIIHEAHAHTCHVHICICMYINLCHMFCFTACHSETNAIISGFRREADLSDCTLYVTYSPCHGCCKVIAQAGIKRVEFAKYYDNCTAGYESLQRLPGMNIT